MKAMPRNAARNAAAAEVEPYRPELVDSDEPRYLRRQKPVEIRRKKFGGKTLSFYKNLFLWALVAGALLVAAYFGADFLLHSPKVLLLKPDQVEVNGNHVVPREAVLASFKQDRGRSVLRIPLEARRNEVEQIAWVQSASVQRVLPNHVRVEITERTPIAFVRNGSELALIDAAGVILDRPRDEDLNFPIVTGLNDNMPRPDREKLMQNFQEFIRAAELIRPGSTDHISEVDLSDAHDLRVVMAGFPGVNATQAVTVHFGSGEFNGKYRLLVENFARWQAKTGCVQSIDLRYTRQIPVNADPNGCTDTSLEKKR